MDYKFKVLKVETSDIKRDLKYKGSFTITFTRDPFYYYAINTDEITITNNYTIISPEVATDSEPIIKVTGTGAATITINNKNINLNNLNGTIHIDSTLKECYSDTYENLNNKMNGEYPKLIKGNNHISWTGSITSVKVVMNWRCIG